MAKLFEPLMLRSVTFRNRIGVSPMCQYSCIDGVVGDWHLVHLGSRAVGGAGLVMAEATAVTPEGRISPGDTGIWNDTQKEAWRKVAGFIAEYGAVPGIQLAHAGWKGSTAAPWKGGKAVPATDGGWQPIGVGGVPFTDGYPTPKAMTEIDIDQACEAWHTAAIRALEAGFKVIEIHAARVTLERNHVMFTPPVAIDARMKPWYPAEVSCDPVTASLVTDRWCEYFPHGRVAMGDAERGHLD